MSKLPNRPRLGRGLNSLMGPPPTRFDEIPDPPTTNGPQPVPPADQAAGTSDPAARLETTDADVSAPPRDGFMDVPLDAIRPNPHQPRRQMNEASLGELAASIRTNGLIQPAIVRRADAGFELIAGERRYRAAKLAGLTTMPVIVRQADTHTQAQLALIENIHREDLNAVDRAEAYQTLLTRLGLTQVELAGRLGEDRSSIANYLRLLELAPPVREYLRNGLLSMGHAKVLAGVTEPNEQARVADLTVSQGLSVRNLERLLSVTATLPYVKPAPPTPHLQRLEKSIARQLGLRVQVRTAAKAGRGRVTIHYGSLDQFDDLMKRLDVNADLEE